MSSIPHRGSTFTVGSVPHIIKRRHTIPSSSTPSPSISQDFIHALQLHRKESLCEGPEAEEIPWTLAKDALKQTRKTLRRRKEIIEERQTKMEKQLGTAIDETHANYMLMYNMLTGIRTAVSRITVKAPRELAEEDFAYSYKLTFDVMGNELPLASKYDFKFKDYAPWVFSRVRELFHISSTEYLKSLTSKYILSELGSPGKSGSFFYYSQDYRFVIKTIRRSEHRFMLSILREYYEHIGRFPNTLLCRFYGLHRVKLAKGRPVYFVVMGNILPPNRDVHAVFDLKGSTYKRFLPYEALQKNPRAVLKDLNWLQDDIKLELGPVKRAQFIQQLQTDVMLLARLNIMDYSLLIGLHNSALAHLSFADHNLALFAPKAPRVRLANPFLKRSKQAVAFRKALVESDPFALQRKDAVFPQAGFKDLRYSVFYYDDGGFAATTENNEPSSSIYYMGIIDILTPYNAAKRAEHLWLSLLHGPRTISAINPQKYASRFFRFITHSLRVQKGVSSEVDYPDT